MCQAQFWVWGIQQRTYYIISWLPPLEHKRHGARAWYFAHLISLSQPSKVGIVIIPNLQMKTPKVLRAGSDFFD